MQLSDTHIGFNKEANPEVAHTLRQTIDLVNAMPERPSLILHTGDITHLSRPEEFDTAAQLLSQLNVSELHTVPGEHDVADAAVSQYFDRFGKPSGRKGYYSFDRGGVHFVALINVLNFKPGGLGALGDEQLEWLERDLKGRSSSTPMVVFAHMPLWTIYEPWGWGTADADRAFAYLRRFGSVTVLNGHIHRIVQKVEGHLTFHTALSTAYPQPTPGAAAAPGPLKVPGDQLPRHGRFLEESRRRAAHGGERDGSVPFGGARSRRPLYIHLCKVGDLPLRLLHPSADVGHSDRQVRPAFARTRRFGA